MLHDPEQTKAAVVGWIQDYFAQNAPNAAAVIGISGGKDSSVAAALCAEALGERRVIGVTMPDGVQPDLADSHRLLTHLWLPYIEINIRSIREAFGDTLTGNPAFSTLCGRNKLTEQARINLPPRIRMSVLYAVAQSLSTGGLVVNTCNRSEDYVGYSTKFGDAAGDFSPLAEFTAREVLQLGRTLGLLESLLAKAPSDGLSGVTDEEKLGFSYAVLDDYLETGICPDDETRAKIERLHAKNLHKLQPMPRYQKRKSD